MVRQAQAEAALAQRIPMVVWRRNKGEWRVDVPLSWFFAVLKTLLRGAA